MKYIINPIANTIGWFGIGFAFIGLETIGMTLMYFSDGIKR
jgi:hypothetical protein